MSGDTINSPLPLDGNAQSRDEDGITGGVKVYNPGLHDKGQEV
jgi:hypothetical protein